ncbi:MAG: hypothetical protein A3F67_03210 [Verrucomicrobia bacterium RIFCSPHIGHO2_12_FULL_41_10]|nr:MAG: hypothetical protein A3F67_03210 [Verrucomicrobia bacterium RIFCSPHIGHO2_12_FULL_41_10]HLB33614.1 hypothetical protein [Chthoniobacterales bacterium]
MKKLLSAFVLLLVFACLAHANLVIDYHEYISPDKLYVAQATHEEGDTILGIKNRKTGEVEASFTIVPLVVHVQWAPDSKSLLIVQHISGGSVATIVHHDDNKWVHYDCDPPLKTQGYYYLVGVKFLKEVVRLTYGVYPSKRSSLSDTKICVFDVNYNTGFMVLDQFGPLTKKGFDKLTKKEQRKWKMWENGTSDKEMRSSY